MNFGYGSEQNQQTSSGRAGQFQESGSINLSRGNQSSSGSQWNASKSTPGFMTELGTILNRNINGEGPYSKDAAISDVQGVLKTRALDAMQSALPQIARTNTSAGAYSSTTQDLLQNDFGARLANQLAATQLDAITKYGTLGNQQIAAFSGATSAGTTNESSGGGSQSSSGTQDSIGLQSSLGISENLSQSQGSGDSMNMNFGIGKADGGEIKMNTWEDVSPHSLVSAGNTPFSLLSEYFAFDGTGARKNNTLSILPQLLRAASSLQGGGDGTTGVEPTAAPAPSKQSESFEPDPYLRVSDGAMRFMKENNLKNIDEANEAIQMAVKRGTIHSMKGLQNIRDIKEFAPSASEVNRVVYGANDYNSNRGEHIFNSQGETQGGYTGAGAADGGVLMGGETSNSLSRRFQENIWEQTRQRREAEAGTSGSGITINVNTGSGSTPAAGGGAANQIKEVEQDPIGMLRKMLGFADGGQITDTGNLQRAIQQHANGGAVPHIMERTSKSGTLGGPQSQSGRDNQLVAVAGGEGVIPVDVMQVPGVSDLLKNLISTYHKKVQ